MNLTVAICTRNRSRMLRRALQSLVKCEQPPAAVSWEVLVVDNGSTDDSSAVAASFHEKLPLRLACEPEPGLSNARNRVLDDARGDWIVWIDDDVTVEKRWLNAYVGAIARHPGASVLGGPIDVRFEGPAPRWLQRGLWWILDAYAGRSCSDCLGRFFSDGPKPYGANFAIARACLRGQRFDPDLGRHPLRPTWGGEETELIRAVLAECGEGWWVPEARVVHHIDDLRQTTGYLRAYYHDAGYASARATRATLGAWVKGLGAALARACVNELRYAFLCLTREQERRALRLRDAAWHWGYARGQIHRLLMVTPEDGN